MTGFQMILVTTLLLIWCCISLAFLITAIQDIFHNRRKEKREQEQEIRDRKYHNKRMELLK